MNRITPFSVTEYLPPVIKSLPSYIQVATPPRGDQGAASSFQVRPSSVVKDDFPKAPSRFAPTNQSLPSKTIGELPANPGIRSLINVQRTPSAEVQTSCAAFLLLTLSPSMTLPPIIQRRF